MKQYKLILHWFQVVFQIEVVINEKRHIAELFQSKNKRIKVPVKCFYVNVANHVFLIDAGWSEKVVENAKKHLGFGLYFASEPVMSRDESARSQLNGEHIDCILMTHLDCDHISGIYDFPNKKIFCSREEHKYSHINRIRYGKLLKNRTFDYIDFKDDEKAIFGKSSDIFGDGSVIAYLTPTHSAGSVIYKIIEDNKYYLVVGDNGYMKESWEKGILPGVLYDSGNMLKCLKWIKDKSEDKNCLGILCAHENM